MQVAQGDVLKTGDATRYFIYVNAGCLMTYYTDKAGVDHVIQFSTTGWWAGDLHNLTKADRFHLHNHERLLTAM